VQKTHAGSPHGLCLGGRIVRVGFGKKGVGAASGGGDCGRLLSIGNGLVVSGVPKCGSIGSQH